LGKESIQCNQLASLYKRHQNPSEGAFYIVVVVALLLSIDGQGEP
jgi:hypothetical protein